VWRFGHIEQRWALAPSGSSAVSAASLPGRSTEHERARDGSAPSRR
jgi:hypothetical protein